MAITDEKRKAMAAYVASPLNRFVTAAGSGDVAAMSLAMSEVASIDEREPWYGRTALHCAAGSGSVKAIEFLAAAGASLNLLDGNLMTPLMCACSTGKTKGSKAALVLLRHGADILYVRESDEMDAIKFALWGRCSTELIKKLRELGAPDPGPGFRIVNLD